MKHARKVVILHHDSSGQLANQLWNFMSIYAYCLEKGYVCSNYSFFRYIGYFNIPRPPFYIHFPTIASYHILTFLLGKKHGVIFHAKLYTAFSRLIEATHKSQVLYSRVEHKKTQVQYYLPPTPSPQYQYAHIDNDLRTLYFVGWKFRNPMGIQKWRTEITSYFRPVDKISSTVNARISELRKKYAHIAGVHIRQGDYRDFKGGRFFVDEDRVAEILSSYLKETVHDAKNTLFLVTTDGSLNPNVFERFQYVVSGGTAIEDLFLLSECDVVIGSDSTFGAFGAYIGNIPHIIMTKDPIDWEYYRGKTTFFEGKYSTRTHF